MAGVGQGKQRAEDDKVRKVLVAYRLLTIVRGLDFTPIWEVIRVFDENTGMI